MSKNMVESKWQQMTIWQRVLCWISRATREQAHTPSRTPTPTHAHTHMLAVTCTRARTYTHTDQYIILIAFPQQQWFRERASLLRYTYITCLVKVWNIYVSHHWWHTFLATPTCLFKFRIALRDVLVPSFLTYFLKSIMTINYTWTSFIKRTTDNSVYIFRQNWLY